MRKGIRCGISMLAAGIAVIAAAYQVKTVYAGENSQETVKTETAGQPEYIISENMTADGNAAYSLVKIDGVEYLFNSNGKVVTNEWQLIGKQLYYADSKGKAYKAKNEWNKFNGSWYYVKDNKNVKGFNEIDGNLYYFDSSEGKMYENTEIIIISQSESKRYKIRPDGRLYRNQWFLNGMSGSWYYYDNDGAMVTGIYEINGDKYVFGKYGSMLRGEINVTDDRLFFIDAEGVAVEAVEGWNKYMDGRYYVKDGKLIEDGFFETDGSRYYFEDGKMVVDRYIPDWTTDTLYEISATGEAQAVKGSRWVLNENGKWLFVDKDNKIVTGWKNLGNDRYLFKGRDSEEAGTCYYSCLLHLNGKSYSFDPNGKLLMNCWINFGHEYVYANKDGELVKGDVNIDGTWYTFNSKGYMLTGLVKGENGEFYYYRDDGSYLGRVENQEGWNKIGDCWYYIKDGELCVSESVTMPDGNVYAFDNRGRMITEQFYTVHDTKLNKDILLYLKSSGKAAKGWLRKLGAWYYADADTGELATGFRTIDSKSYYFENSGKMRVGEIWKNNVLYVTDSDGVIQSSTTVWNGWYYGDGKYYYYKDKKAYTGWVDDYYISNGVMKRNSKINDSGKIYIVDASGKRVKKNSWYLLNNQWYYIKENGTVAYNSWIKLSGKWYYASEKGYIYTDKSVLINGKWNYFDEDGVWVAEICDKKKTGWVKKNNEWFYYIGGKPADGVKKIDGEYYYFDGESGKMKTNTVYNMYFYGEDGVRTEYKGWKKIKGLWCYFDDNYRFRSGWLDLNGKVYYMQAQNVDGIDGRIYTLVTDTKIYYASDFDDKMYKLDKDGVITGLSTNLNGWRYLSYIDKWVYFRNGKAVTGVVEIDKKMYIFNANGYMYTSQLVNVMNGCFLCGSDGAVITKTGWYKNADGLDVYIDEAGRVVDGIVKWNGKEYVSYR